MLHRVACRYPVSVPPSANDEPHTGSNLDDPVRVNSGTSGVASAVTPGSSETVDGILLDPLSASGFILEETSLPDKRADIVSGNAIIPQYGSNPSNGTSVSSLEQDLLSDQWLLPFLPSPATTPPLAKHSMELILRVFRTWPCMMAREVPHPPIFHPSQVSENAMQIPLAIALH